MYVRDQRGLHCMDSALSGDGDANPAGVDALLDTLTTSEAAWEREQAGDRLLQQVAGLNVSRSWRGADALIARLLPFVEGDDYDGRPARSAADGWDKSSS